MNREHIIHAVPKEVSETQSHSDNRIYRAIFHIPSEAYVVTSEFEVVGTVQAGKMLQLLVEDIIMDELELAELELWVAYWRPERQGSQWAGTARVGKWVRVVSLERKYKPLPQARLFNIGVGDFFHKEPPCLFNKILA